MYYDTPFTYPISDKDLSQATVIKTFDQNDRPLTLPKLVFRHVYWHLKMLNIVYVFFRNDKKIERTYALLMSEEPLFRNTQLPLLQYVNNKNTLKKTAFGCVIDFSTIYNIDDDTWGVHLNVWDSDFESSQNELIHENTLQSHFIHALKAHFLNNENTLYTSKGLSITIKSTWAHFKPEEKNTPYLALYQKTEINSQKNTPYWILRDSNGAKRLLGLHPDAKIGIKKSHALSILDMPYFNTPINDELIEKHMYDNDAALYHAYHTLKQDLINSIHGS